MQLNDILTPERCFCDLEAVSKKRILKRISELIEKDIGNVSASSVLEALMAREQLGSTGVGNGIAIPHCRVAECDRTIGALVTLKDPIDFDVVDSRPVDLLFVLVVPEKTTDEHVRTLGRIAELFSDQNFCHTVRNTHSSEELFRVAISH